MPNNEKVISAILNTQQRLDEADLTQLLEKGLHEYIDELQLEIGNLHFKIAETWFLPVVVVQSQSQEQKSA